MPAYRARIEYDGTGYYGFQRQREEHPTIQGELEKALAPLAQRPIVVRGAGRTDSGVHALGQVISFTLEWRYDHLTLQRAMNARLPADIAVLQLEEVASTFHPRFDACRRTYIYHIYNAAQRSPIRRLRSWHVRTPLDVEKMDQAAATLIGEQDFATFGQAPQGENTVREVFEASCQRESDLILFTISANAFLYRMVRSIVGSLKVVGNGRWTVADFAEALHACDRSRSQAAAPPHGLYLTSVTYKE